MTNYLNDFASCATWDMAKHDFEMVGDILKNCGLAESIDKACPPSTEMVFLGVLFDTNKHTRNHIRLNELEDDPSVITAGAPL